MEFPYAAAYLLASIRLSWDDVEAFAVPPGTETWARGAILACSFVIEIAWYGLVIALLSTGRARRAYDRCGAWIERAIGSLLIVFGVRLATERP